MYMVNSTLPRHQNLPKVRAPKNPRARTEKGFCFLIRNLSIRIGSAGKSLLYIGGAAVLFAGVGGLVFSKDELVAAHRFTRSAWTVCHLISHQPNHKCP
jgi:hypothetical protein